MSVYFLPFNFYFLTDEMDNMDLTCGHFVNPFTDIGFKIIFGQPASKELLITLLNELLAGEHRIENLIFSGQGKSFGQYGGCRDYL